LRAWLTELATIVLRFDRSSLEPGYVLRCTTGVAIPLVAATLLGHPALGVAAALGAFITGFTSLQGVYRTRMTAVLAAAFGMALTSFIGALAANSTIGIVAATAVAGYAYGVVAQRGQAASTVALNSLVAFVLFSAQAAPARGALEQSGLVFGGGLIQATLLLLAWPLARLDVERATLADAYRDLAAYARTVAQGSSTLPPMAPFTTARRVLADAQPFARAGEMARVDRVLEDTEAIRNRLGAINAIAVQAADASDLRALANVVATHLAAIAKVLTGDRGQHLERVRDATIGAFDRYEASLATDSLERPIVEDLLTHLRDATQAAMVLSTGRLLGFSLVSKPRPASYVENRTVWFGRDSLRFAIVLSIAMVLGRHFAADRGYWIPLTAALVLKPDLQTTFVRGIARIAGTLLGAVVATGVIVLVRGNGELQVVATILAAAAAYLTFNPNYGVFTLSITSFVVLVLAIRGLPGTTTLEARVLDTLAGGTLAMLGYLALPSWERKRTRALLADLIEAQSQLADAILQAYANPSDGARLAIERKQAAIWRIRTTVEASIDRTRREPYKPHTIGAARALRILAASQRFALANLALETGLDTLPSIANAGALLPFADALNARMEMLATALRESQRLGSDDSLDDAFARLESALDRSNLESRFVLDHARGYLEATTRLARLVGVKQSEVGSGVDSA
jgi:uncharacterized membrane protein YccC